MLANTEKWRFHYGRCAFEVIEGGFQNNERVVYVLEYMVGRTKSIYKKIPEYVVHPVIMKKGRYVASVDGHIYKSEPDLGEIKFLEKRSALRVLAKVLEYHTNKASTQNNMYALYELRIDLAGYSRGRKN